MWVVSWIRGNGYRCTCCRLEWPERLEYRSECEARRVYEEKKNAPYADDIRDVHIVEECPE